MKKIIYILALLSKNVDAQTIVPLPPPPPAPITCEPTSSSPIEDGDKYPYQKVDQMPKFPGGDTALVKYLAEKTQYPNIAREICIEGKVFVKFVIDKEGKIIKPVVVRGIGGGLNEEALRVVRTMPAWIPGQQNGKKVNVYVILPIPFRLR
jgi:periplasmic protein TonB